MNEHATPHAQGEEPSNPTVAYERTDVNTRVVIWFVTALAVFIAVVMIGLVWLYSVYFGLESQQKETRFPVAANARERLRETDPDRLLPPSPRLEGISPGSRAQPAGRVRPWDDRQDHDIGRVRPGSAAALYADQERTLNETWEWADKDHTAARIPITEAINRLLAKPGDHLKARGADKAPPAGSGPPRRSSSGRPPGEGEK